ncbi:MFS transporter [Treponema pedis]|uniref:MFS transporter n=1 Tax=Treponema pedis TaxID=409322 RepID=UPI000408154E|nr:MFS transporter [Treponema pedis]
MKKSNLFILLSSITTVSAAFGSGVLYAYILANSVNYVTLGVLTSVMLILTIILEYPSGIIADYIGRKKTYALGAFAASLFYILPVLNTSFIILLIAMIFGAACDAFFSGSLEGWLQSSENSDKDKNSIPALIIKSRRITTALTIFVLLITGIITKRNFSYSIILLCSSAGFMAACLLAVFTGNDTKSDLSTPSLLVKESFKEIFSKKAHWPFFVLLATAFSVFSIYCLFYQKRAENLGLGGSSLLYVKALAALGLFLGALLTGKLKKVKNIKNAFIFIYVLMIISWILFIPASSILFIIAILCYNIAAGVVLPFYFSNILPVLNKEIVSSAISLLNALASVLAVFATMIGSCLLQYYSLKICLMFTIIILLFGFIVTFLTAPKKDIK